MEKKRVSNTKMKQFLKKNIYYLIMALCLIAVAAMVAITVVNQNKENSIIDAVVPDVIDIVEPAVIVDPTPVIESDPIPSDVVDEPVVVVNPIVFASPVDSVDIIQDYTSTSLVWNSTLNHYSTHEAIDFGGADGDSVYSVYSGEVTSVDYDILNGYSVTIKHSDTLSTVYSSLNEPIVTQGQSVLKGTKIGTMGNTATNEYAEGPHLHFIVFENGNAVDPYTYLAIGTK
jgi:murein DD-endopeptidase MepM/ murein hydrolase activator NlpD